MINYYKVGGCVRDELLGVRSKDIDFAVEADSYEAMRDDIIARGYTIFQERPEFLSIRARHTELGGVDFTLCRKEGFYSDNRHPDIVTVGSIYDDLARRDFTVNAIAKTEDGRYIDPHLGTVDLAHMTLKCVGSAKDRFTEDPLRILRAMRFNIIRGFKLNSEIEYMLYSYDTAYSLKTLPKERIYEELMKCFQHDSWATLKFLEEHPRILRVIFNEMGLGLVPTIGGN